MERWTWSSPADAHVFSDHLHSCSSSSILSTQTELEVYSACEYSEIQQLLEEPQDESHLPELLGIISRPTSDYVMPLQMCTYVPPEIKKVRERRRPTPYTVLPEQEEAPATMVLGGERGGKEEDEEKEEESREGEGSIKVSGTRGPRKRGTWKRGTWFRNHFLNAPCFGSLCSASKGEKRENDKHWTPKEVKLLVDGVSELGVGHWTELKNGWFSDSNSGPVRTAANLKDKWRNLVKAYVFRPNSKKKGKYAHLDKDLINKIQMLAAEYPCPK